MVNMLQLSSECGKSGLYDFQVAYLEDEKRPGRPKKFEDKELEAVLDDILPHWNTVHTKTGYHKLTGNFDKNRMNIFIDRISF